MSLIATTSQTVGPYLQIGLTWLNRDTLVSPGVSGERITIEGRLVDGDGKPVSDGVIEIWQANAHGRYAHPEDRQDKKIEPAFRGFGRVPTDANGMYRFATIKPGRVPASNGTLQAPHIAVTVFMRGMLKQLVTRIYFPGEVSNADDEVLRLVDPARRATLVAKAIAGRQGAFEWNILLQGEDETVFFDC